MSWWLLSLNACWAFVALGGAYLAYMGGMRREHARWTDWYDREQALKETEQEALQQQREAAGSNRGVTLATVQFTRD